MYGFSYALGALLIRRWFLANRVPKGYTWAIALVLLVIATTIIPLISSFLSPASGIRTGLSVVPPTLFADLFGGQPGVDIIWPSVSIAAISTLVVGILNLPWFIRQINDFRPPRPEATSTNRKQTNPKSLRQSSSQIRKRRKEICQLPRPKEDGACGPVRRTYGFPRFFPLRVFRG